ncbi:hypothetical protein ACFL5O_08040 [Myxococcota bacterium]
MNHSDTYRDYLVATNELLIEFAREAEEKISRTRGTEEGKFDAGYVMGFHRVISLMQQQADAFGFELADIGLEGIDPNRDLI